MSTKNEQAITTFCKKYGLTEDQFSGREKYEGYLDLSGLTSIPEGFNPTVGGYLYLRGLTSNHTPLKNRLLTWKNGKYVLADGIFTEVLSKKGRVYTVRDIGSTEEYYLVTDGKSTHAHGETIEQAKADLRFKRIAEKVKTDPINADTVITIPYYRAVTGACEFGINSWIDATFSQKEKADIVKNGIKAKILLPILKKKHAYGYERFQQLVAF